MLTHPAAQQIQQWPIERLVEYRRNPRKNDAAENQMKGKKNLKIGSQTEQTALHEDFSFAITQPGYVKPCGRTTGLVPHDLIEGGQFASII